MIKSSILIFFISINIFLNAQTGHFGKLNNFEFSISGAVGAIPKSKIYFSTLTTKYKVLSPILNLTYNRIIGNDISLNFGYSFSKIKTALNRYESFNIIEPSFKYHTFKLGVDFFGSKAINPLGIFGGASIEYSGTPVNINNLRAYEKIQTKKQSFLKSIYTVNIIDTISYSKSYDGLKSFSFHFHFGKNYLINRQFYISLKSSFSPISIVSHKGISVRSNLFNIINYNRSLTDNYYNNLTAISQSIYMNKIFRINIGIHYSF